MSVTYVTLYPPGGNGTTVQVVEGSQLHLIYAAMGFSATPVTPGPPKRPDPFPQYVHDDEIAALLAGAQDSAVASLIDDTDSATSERLRAASVAAVEDADEVTPTGAWDFTGAVLTGVGGSANTLVFNVRDYGAKGDGTTDDSAAFAACRDAAIATARTPIDSNKPVTAVISIPPGRYKLTQNNALMTPGSGTADGLAGLSILGGGKHSTTLVWAPTTTSTTDPTVGNLFSANKRAQAFHIADFSVEITNPAANVFYFTNAGEGAQNQGNVFERLHFHGSCQRVFGFDGGATANLNSEMTFNNISALGAYGDAFMRVGGISGVFNQQNQFVNYWINESWFILQGGTLFRFDQGGSARFTNGSWSSGSSANPAMTFLSMPVQNFNNTAATSFTVRGIRFEPKAADHVVIDCRMGQGNVTFAECSDVGALQFAGSEDYNLHRYVGGTPWGPGTGPTVRYQDCALAGYHSYDGAGAAQELGSFVYDGCFVWRGGNSLPAATTQEEAADALLQWSNGRPRFVFRSGWNHDDVSSDAVVSGSGGAPVRTRTVYAVGDSLTEGAGSGGGGITRDATVFPTAGQGALQYQGGSWVPWALFASDARWTIGGVFATGGYTAAQILATHVPQVIADATAGDTVVVLAGTNGNVLADVKAIHEALHDAGLYTVACTIPPSTSSTLSLVDGFNAGLKKYAADRGIPLVDLHAAVVNPATGAYASAYNGDGVHPNQLGAQLFGQTVAAVLNTFHASPVTLVDHNATVTGQLQPNPLAQNALTDGTDYGLMVGLGTSTIASGADTDFRGGKAYVLTRGNTNIDAHLAKINFVAGHRYRVGFAVKATTGAWGIRWESDTTGGKVLLGIGYPAPFTIAQGIGRFYLEFTVPTLPDYRYRPRLDVSNAGTVLKLGEITVQDLTVMGAA